MFFVLSQIKNSALESKVGIFIYFDPTTQFSIQVTTTPNRCPVYRGKKMKC
jgi:hypothetical protein